MSAQNSNDVSSAQVYYQIARGTAIVTGIFILVLSILMIAHYLQSKAVDPLNSPVLTTLLQKLDENPNDEELKAEIRALDLLARKAYFTNIWQIRVGGFLLLTGVIILLISMKVMSSLQKQLPNPKTLPEKADFWKSNSRTRKAMIIGASFLVGFSLLAGVLSHSDLQDNNVFNQAPSLISAETLAQHWINFRGPEGNAHARYANIPTHWDIETDENIIWKVEVPLKGYSSPIVYEDYLFVTGGNEKTQEVFCYQTSDGKLRWRQPVPELPGTPPELEVDEGTGFAAPTPATNGRHVFAIFATGDLVCFDLNGKFIWGRNLGVPDNHYGHSSSLITFENLLIVQYDQNSNSKLFGLDANTGKTVWEVPRTAISWSSPICVNTGNRMELILTNSEAVDAYDPKTGKHYWTQACLGGEVGPSAAYAEGIVVVGNEYANGAGIKLDENGQATIAWEFDEALPNTSSPIVTEKYALFATSDGYAVSLNAKTGELIWEQEFDYGFYASAIVVDERVYLMDLKGTMQIFKLADTFESVATPSIGEDSACTPAVLDGRIYLRGDKHLFCIGNK